jgi:putative nucleotidyltransferase with HDIG domain
LRQLLRTGLWTCQIKAQLKTGFRKEAIGFQLCLFFLSRATRDRPNNQNEPSPMIAASVQPGTRPASAADSAARIIAQVEHLPPAPTVAIELLDLFDDPNRDVDRVVELIRLDPSLTARVLQRCNTAHFAGTNPASDMFEVVMRLGFYEVYCVVAAQVMANSFLQAKPQVGVDLNQLWRHSVITAVTAAELARCAQIPDAPAFTAGLLHDLGKLIFAGVAEARYADQLQRHGQCGYFLSQAERSAYGVDHAQLGAELLSRWGLPETIVETVRHHHAAPSTAQPPNRLAAAVKLANTLAYFLDPVHARVCDMGSCVPNALQILGVGAGELPGCLTRIKSGLDRVQGLLPRNP